jgi:predicted phosphodiesterase
MKLAIISDIHSNLEALEAALEDIKTLDLQTIYCTGDLVGYGASPNEVIELLRNNRVKCLIGNHDYACLNQRSMDSMIRNAREAIAYTRRILAPESIDVLKNLPGFIHENGVYLTHGLPPALFLEYLDLQSKNELIQAFLAFPEQVAFVGHTHLFDVVEMTASGKIEKYEFDAFNLDLKPTSRYLISAGSIGQPRDDNREAGYLIYDTEIHQIIKRTFQYNVELTIEKIKLAGLPLDNGRRLLKAKGSTNGREIQ